MSGGSAKPASTAIAVMNPRASGTALGVVRAAWEDGKKIRVVAGETRPVLQGARLTAWELMQDGIPVTLITDNMAGTLMSQGKVHVCVVGADRIAATGDPAAGAPEINVAVVLLF